MPSKTSNRVAVGIALALGALVIGMVAWGILERKTPGPPPRLAFTGFEYSPVGKVATFSVTNTESRAILVSDLYRAVIRDSGWNSLGVLDGDIWFEKSGRTTREFEHRIKPGKHLKILAVEPPGASRWRLSGIISRKVPLVKELQWRVRMAWEKKTFPGLGLTFWAPSPERVDSEVISSQPR